MTEWPHCSVVEAIGLGLFACEWTHLQATLWLVMFAQMFLAFSMGVAQFTIRWGAQDLKGHSEPWPFAPQLHNSTRDHGARS